MRRISIRTVIISNLVQLSSVLGLIVLAALATLAAVWMWAAFPEDIKPITEGLRSSPLLLPLMGAVSVIPSSTMAGYVAGQMTTESRILHGALSSCAWLILLVLIVLFGAPTGPHGGSPPVSNATLSIGFFIFAPVGVTISIGAPLLGALGGLLARRRGSSDANDVWAGWRRARPDVTLGTACDPILKEIRWRQINLGGSIDC
jgi:hypothetical protein